MRWLISKLVLWYVVTFGIDPRDDDDGSFEA
jgi:hypothetical protein